MLHKNLSLLEIKADGEAGEFTALVSTFGNIDKVGDRIMRGAYEKTLAQRRVSGDPLPIIFAHQWGDPWAHVGVAAPEDVVETEKGLLVRGKLDVEDNPLAAQVHKLMKRRTLKEFSIGFSVPKGGERRAKDGANEISEIDLAECGPCLKGIDPKTELHEVKSAVHEHARDTELQALKARVDALEKALENSRKAEEAGKETKSRPVDPLRQQAESTALEFASDGLSLRQPPRQVKQPTVEPEIPLDALKRRMRDEILTHLSGEPL